MSKDNEIYINVVIPVYNGEKFLKECIESVVMQPIPNLHIVLVDDGSTDNTPILCDEYEQRYSYIHTIHQKNSGVSRARNVGLDYILNICTCGYIIFLDADDRWFKLSGKVIEKIVNNTADIVGFSTYFSNEEGNRFKLNHQYTEQYLQKEKAGTTDWILGGHLNAHFLKLDLIKSNKIRFMEEVKYNEDIIFMRQAIYCAKSFSFNAEKLYIYRNNSSSVTATETERDSIDRCLAVVKAWERASEWKKKSCVSEDKYLDDEWTKLCSTAIGAILLEAARLSAENGASIKEIIAKYRRGVYARYLYQLKNDSLAVWQKKDYLLFFSNIKIFVLKYYVYGIIKRIIYKILKNKIIHEIWERKKYRIKESELL